MKTIEIKIPELGKAVGTTNYVSEKLDHISRTLKSGSTKNDEPCLTYDHWSDKNEKGNPKRYILCFISPDMSNEVCYQNINDVWSVNALTDLSYRVGLFAVLSEKAKEKVDEFLYNVAVNFKEEYNKN